MVGSWWAPGGRVIGCWLEGLVHVLCWRRARRLNSCCRRFLWLLITKMISGGVADMRQVDSFRAPLLYFRQLHHMVKLMNLTSRGAAFSTNIPATNYVYKCSNALTTTNFCLLLKSHVKNAIVISFKINKPINRYI